MKKILGIGSMIGCIMLSACGSFFSDISGSIEVSGEEYVTGFYDEDFWYVRQEAIVWKEQAEMEKCREVTGAFDSYTMLGENHSTNGVLYVRAEEEEAAQNYYSEYDNFVYKCQIGKETLYNPEPEAVILEDISYEKLKELQDFANKYANTITHRDNSHDTLAIPFGESDDYEQLIFWAESPDGVLSSTKANPFYLKNDQMWFIRESNGKAGCEYVIELPEDLAEYFVDVYQQL